MGVCGEPDGMNSENKSDKVILGMLLEINTDKYPNDVFSRNSVTTGVFSEMWRSTDGTKLLLRGGSIMRNGGAWMRVPKTQSLLNQFRGTSLTTAPPEPNSNEWSRISTSQPSHGQHAGTQELAHRLNEIDQNLRRLSRRIDRLEQEGSFAAEGTLTVIVQNELQNQNVTKVQVKLSERHDGGGFSTTVEPLLGNAPVSAGNPLQANGQAQYTFEDAQIKKYGRVQLIYTVERGPLIQSSPFVTWTRNGQRKHYILQAIMRVVSDDGHRVQAQIDGQQ